MFLAVLALTFNSLSKYFMYNYQNLTDDDDDIDDDDDDEGGSKTRIF
jgi:hypothetical protein